MTTIMEKLRNVSKYVAGSVLACMLGACAPTLYSSRYDMNRMMEKTRNEIRDTYRKIRSILSQKDIYRCIDPEWKYLIKPSNIEVYYITAGEEKKMYEESIPSENLIWGIMKLQSDDSTFSPTLLTPHGIQQCLYKESFKKVAKIVEKTLNKDGEENIGVLVYGDGRGNVLAVVGDKENIDRYLIGVSLHSDGSLNMVVADINEVKEYAKKMKKMLEANEGYLSPFAVSNNMREGDGEEGERIYVGGGIEVKNGEEVGSLVVYIDEKYGRELLQSAVVAGTASGLGVPFALSGVLIAYYFARLPLEVGNSKGSAEGYIENIRVDKVETKSKDFKKNFHPLLSSLWNTYGNGRYGDNEMENIRVFVDLEKGVGFVYVGDRSVVVKKEDGGYNVNIGKGESREGELIEEMYEAVIKGLATVLVYGELKSEMGVGGVPVPENLKPAGDVSGQDGDGGGDEQSTFFGGGGGSDQGGSVICK